MPHFPQSTVSLCKFVGFVGCLLATWTGCASGESGTQTPVHPVKGRVLVNNQPAAGAFVLLVPENESGDVTTPRPHAEVAEDGGFQLSTFGANDGAPAGDYRVTIHWPGGTRPDGSEEPPDKLMGRYSDPAKSKMRVTVTDGNNELPPFQLK